MIERVDEQGVAPRFTPPLVVARNSLLNLCNETWTFLVVFAAMPILVRILGKEGFGLFSLAWVILGYMAILDLGVSRAATKFISEHLSQQQLSSVERVCRTAITSNLILGMAGGAVVLFAAPWLTIHLFRIPTSLQGEARIALEALALSIPVLLAQAVLRAILSSYQRFGWINLVNSGAVTLQWGSAALLAFQGVSLGRIVIVCVFFRALATVAYAIVLASIDANFLRPGFADLRDLGRLLRFGGWVSISQLMTPILIYLDRILIASLTSLAAMAVYVIPYEVIARVRVIPSSLVNALFPSLSEHSVTRSRHEHLRLYSESLRYMLLILFPVFLVLSFMGADIISLWIGPDYAAAGGIVLRILAIGALLNSMSYVPYAALIAFGRPDLPAKFHLAELPLYLLVSLWLIPRWGIAGAAVAVALRLTADAIALLWAAAKYVDCTASYRRVHRVIVINIALALAFMLIRSWADSASVRLAGATCCLVAYGIASWFFVLGDGERPLFLRILQLGGRTA